MKAVLRICYEQLVVYEDEVGGREISTQARAVELFELKL